MPTSRASSIAATIECGLIAASIASLSEYMISKVSGTHTLFDSKYKSFS